MTSTPRERRLQFAVTVVLVTANLFILNWLALGHYGRVDLTRDGVYTLHPATRKLLKDLDDLVTAKVYLSEDMFLKNPGWSLLPRQVKDKIDEFVAQADGKLQVEYKDPSADEELKREALESGVQQIPLSSADSSSMQLFQPFCGVTLQYGGKSELIPVAEPSRLEYDLAMSITKLTRNDTVTIGFNVVNMLPEGLPPDMLAQLRDQIPRDLHDLDGDYRALATELRKQFVVEAVPLTAAVPEHVNLLVVANTKGLNDVHKFHLDQYIMRGGKVIFLADGVEPPTSQQMPVPTARDAANDEFFKHYGFAVKKNLIFDVQCASDGSRTRLFHIPEIQPSYFDPDSALVANLGRFVMWFASSIELIPTPGVEPVVLCQTSPGAWEQQGFFDITPEAVLEARRAMKSEDLKQFDVVGMLKGKFTSYFANRPLPEGLSGAATGPTMKELNLDPADLDGADESGEDDSETTTDGTAKPPEEPAKAPAEPVKPDEPAKKDNDVPGGGISTEAQDTPAPAPVVPPAATVPAEPAATPPAAPTGEEQADPPGTTKAIYVVRESPPDTTIVVIGSSMMLTNPLIQGSAGTLEFFWSLVERLTTGGELSEIRNKLIDVPAVRADYSPAEKSAFQYVGMLGVPAIVLAIGIMVFFVSKAKSGRAS